MAYSLTFDKTGETAGKGLVAGAQALSSGTAVLVQEWQRHQRDRLDLSGIDAKDLGYPAELVEHGNIGALSFGGKLAYAAFCGLAGVLGLALLIQLV